MTEEWRDTNTLLYSEAVNCRGRKPTAHYITTLEWDLNLFPPPALLNREHLLEVGEEATGKGNSPNLPLTGNLRKASHALLNCFLCCCKR